MPSPGPSPGPTGSPATSSATVGRSARRTGSRGGHNPPTSWSPPSRMRGWRWRGAGVGPARSAIRSGIWGCWAGVACHSARTGSWQPQNPDLYRLPIEVPPLSVLQEHQAKYHDPGVDAQFDRFAPGLRAVCCSPPIIQYQGDLIEAAFDSEGIGRHDGTDLLYVNYKSPDYTGHVYNMVSFKTMFALREVDEQLGRLSRMLASRFTPGEYALIVTADHGQCPTVDLAGGVRVDPIQLKDDLNREFGGPILDVVTRVVPSEVYLDDRALWDVGASRDDVAAYLRDYRYRDNIGPYVSRDAIEWNRLDQKPFAAVLSTDYIEGLGDRDLSSFGPGRYLAESDPDGVPPITW